MAQRVVIPDGSPPEAAGRSSSLIRFASIASVPRRIVALTAVTAGTAGALAIASGWPLWAIALVAVVPLVPLLTLELTWTYRHYGWLSFFYLLVITQTGHFIEHIVQMVQIHVLDNAPQDAHGIFGQLDIEWVHVIFNTWVLIAVVGLLFRFPRNRWLWLGAVVAGWHEIEHLYIIFFYVRDGVNGNPGLLAEGGRIGGGLDVRRPDLHFVYNVVETLPLYIGFGIEVRRSFDRWLAAAFPRLPADELRRLTNRLRVERFPAGATIVHEGDLADSMYVVAGGEVEVVRPTPSGGRRIAVLGPGQLFGEIGLLRGTPRTATVQAVRPAEVIPIGRDALRDVLASEDTASELGELVAARLAEIGSTGESSEASGATSRGTLPL